VPAFITKEIERRTETSGKRITSDSDDVRVMPEGERA
jgi:hypothetical protein